MENRTFSAKKTLLVCLTTAIVATFAAVAVKALMPVLAKNGVNPPVPVTTPTDDGHAAGGSEISLDPNLSSEVFIADGQAIFAENYTDGIFVVYNDEQSGFALKTDKKATAIKQVRLDGKATAACVSGNRLYVVTVNGNSTRVVSVDFDNGDNCVSRSYDNQKALFAAGFDDGAAMFFWSEGDAGKRLVFRFYADGEEKVERYAITQYDLSLVDLYRIGDNFKLFFSYYSEFSAGGGYADFSLSSITAKVSLIERNRGYTLFSAIPRENSYALLCGSDDGAFIMQLDEKLMRSKKFDLGADKPTGGKMSFDGKNYYSLLLFEKGGKAFKMSGDFTSNEQINRYNDMRSIAGEMNTGGRLVHLLSGEKMFFLTSTEGLFSKKVNYPDYEPISLVKVSGGCAALCNKLSDNGKSKVYACVFN